MKRLLLIIFICFSFSKCKRTTEDMTYHVIVSDTAKTYSGNVFWKGSDNTIALVNCEQGYLLKIYGDKKLLLCDTILMTYYYSDTLMDINNDGKNEFLVYHPGGMGKYVNRDLTCYYLDTTDLSIEEFEDLDTLTNLRFFKGKDYFTSLENQSGYKIASKYKWINSLNFSLQEQIRLYHTDNYDSCTSENYRFTNGQGELISKNKNCDIDTIYGLP